MSEHPRTIIITEGEYSDYTVLVVVEWVSNSNPYEALRVYFAEAPDRKKERFNSDEFIAWLLKNNHAKEIESFELWVNNLFGINPFTGKPQDGADIRVTTCDREYYKREEIKEEDWK